MLDVFHDVSLLLQRVLEEISSIVEYSVKVLTEVLQSVASSQNRVSTHYCFASLVHGFCLTA
jgi:hypothetical protein